VKSTKALKNISVSILTRFFSVASLFFIVPIYLKTLGQDLYGLNVLVNQIAGYLGLLEIGLISGLSIQLYKSIAIQDYGTSSQIISNARNASKTIGILIILAGIFVAFYLDHFIILDSKFVLQGKFSILLASLALSVQFITSASIYFAVFSVHQKSYLVNWVYIVQALISPMLSLLLVWMYKSIVLLQLVTLIGNVLICFYQIRQGEKVFSWLEFKKGTIDSSLLKTSSFVFIDKVFVLIVYYTDYIVISVFMGVKFITVLSICALPFVTFRDFFWNVINNIQSGLGEMFAKEQQHEIFILWKEITGFCWLLAALVCPLFCFTMPTIIQIWTKQKMPADSNFLFLALSLNLCYAFIIQTTLIFVSASIKGLKFRTIISFLELIVNLVLSIILVKKLGVIGCVLGTLTGHLLVSFLPLHSLLGKLLTQKIKVFLFFLIPYFLLITFLYLIDYYLTIHLSNSFLFMAVLMLISNCSIILIFFVFVDSNKKLLLIRFQSFYTLAMSKIK